MQNNQETQPQNANMTPEELTGELLRCLWRMKKCMAAVHASIPLSHSEYSMLYALEELSCQEEPAPDGAPCGVRVSSLSRYTKSSLPGASQILRGLEEKGLVARTVDKRDRRCVYVHFTPEGTRLRRLAQRGFLEQFSKIVQQMGQSNAQQFLRLFQQFTDAVQAVTLHCCNTSQQTNGKDGAATL